MNPTITVPTQKTDARLPIAGLLALAMTGFICIMTETLPAGLLPQIRAGLHISPALAGQMVTAYAIGSLSAAIPLTLVTQRCAAQEGPAAGNHRLCGVQFHHRVFNTLRRDPCGPVRRGCGGGSRLGVAGRICAPDGDARPAGAGFGDCHGRHADRALAGGSPPGHGWVPSLDGVWLSGSCQV